jgi:hypothetical protein
VCLLLPLLAALIVTLSGYDRKGYDKYGYDKEDYHRYGYHKNGYDSYGNDKYGELLPTPPHCWRCSTTGQICALHTV